MLTDEQWTELATATIERSAGLHIEWEKDGHGPDGADGYSAQLGPQSIIAIWGRRAGYSFELTIERQADGVVLLADSRRVTKKVNAGGIPFRELLNAAKLNVEEQKRRADEAVQERIVAWFASELAAHPEHAAARHAYDDVESFQEAAEEVHMDFERSEQITHLTLAATMAGRLTWCEIDGGVLQATANGELQIELEPHPYPAKKNEFGGYQSLDLLTTDDEVVSIVSADFVCSDEAEQLFALAAEQVKAPLREYQQVVNDAIFSDIMSDLVRSQDLGGPATNK